MLFVCNGDVQVDYCQLLPVLGWVLASCCGLEQIMCFET